MKLSQAIEKQFQPFLLRSLLLGIIALSIYSYMTVKNAQDKATNFVFSHVSRIAQSEINSQKVVAIDQEIARVFEAWKSTQDFEIRIDVYLDDKMVGHAGQMQELGYFSTNEARSTLLPSGQNLRVIVSMDLANHVLFSASILFILVAFLCLMFFVFRNELRRTVRRIVLPLEEHVLWLKNVSSDLPNSIHNSSSAPEGKTVEFKALAESSNNFIREISRLEERVKKSTFDESRIVIAEQVAHALKNAAAKLHLKAMRLQGISSEERNSILESVGELRQFTSRVLGLNAQGGVVSNIEKNKDDIDIRRTCTELVERKKSEAIEMKKQIALSFIDNSGRSLVSLGHTIDFETVISDILDNSIESIDTAGSIQLTLSEDHGSTKVEISDDGKGIPDEILPRLMHYRITHGKENGTGLGLFSARKTVEAMGGHITIRSRLGAGTVVTIRIPNTELQKKEVPALVLEPHQTLVIVDDDAVVREAWDFKLKHLKDKIDLVLIASVDEFERWVETNGAFDPAGLRQYIFDYDMKNELHTGLTLIQKYGLHLESLLITGMSNSAKVKNDANAADVKLYSKDVIAEMTISLHETQELSLGGLATERAVN